MFLSPIRIVQVKQTLLYNSVVQLQPIRYSPHVANDHLNVANGLLSKYFKICMFWIKF